MKQFAVTITEAKGRYVVDVWYDEDMQDEFSPEMNIDQFDIPRYKHSAEDPFQEWTKIIGRLHRARDEREWHGA